MYVLLNLQKKTYKKKRRQKKTAKLRCAENIGVCDRTYVLVCVCECAVRARCFQTCWNSMSIHDCAVTWTDDVHSARNEFYLHAGMEKTMQLLECAHFIGIETMLELQQRTFLDYFDKIYNADTCQRHAQRQACDVLLSIMDMVQ